MYITIFSYSSKVPDGPTNVIKTPHIQNPSIHHPHNCRLHQPHSTRNPMTNRRRRLKVLYSPGPPTAEEQPTDPSLIGRAYLN